MFYLIIHETVEEEDEHPLKYIEDGEDVSKDDHIGVDVRQSKHPGDTQETQENQRPSQPGPMERWKSIKFDVNWRNIKDNMDAMITS